MDVVVIGGGLAGLRCATDLVAGGADVMVLEARNRVGGRVFSHRFANGQTCERGAEFIDRQHTEVLSLAESLGLRLTTRRPHPQDTVLVDAFGVFGTAAQASAMQRRVAAGRALRTEFMLPPDEVGDDFAQHVASLRPEGLREAHRIVGGNDQLATALARGLGDRLRLGVGVIDIDGDAGVVTVVGGERVVGTHIVAAVPLPPLSRMWQAMPAPLGAVSYGIGAKFSVQLHRRIWRDHDLSGSVLSDRAWGELWEATDDQPGDAGILTFLLSSHDGAAFATLPDAPRRMLAEIERFFPGGANLAGDQILTDWTNDPLSIGTYACFSTGQLLPAQAVMAQAMGKVWLAGEHADAFTGFMEGALRSGRATATRITAAH